MKTQQRWRRIAAFSLLGWGLILGTAAISTAQAFLFEITTATPQAIAKLSDEKLIDTYITVRIELEAADKFFSNTGMKPKEYEKYKALLRYRTDLVIEIHKRELEAPEIK